MGKEDLRSQIGRSTLEYLFFFRYFLFTAKMKIIFITIALASMIQVVPALPEEEVKRQVRGINDASLASRQFDTKAQKGRQPRSHGLLDNLLRPPSPTSFGSNVLKDRPTEGPIPTEAPMCEDQNDCEHNLMLLEQEVFHGPYSSRREK